MGSLGAPELLIILAIVLLLFGSTRLPKMARSLGQASKEFKKGIDHGEEGDDTPSKSEKADRADKAGSAPKEPEVAKADPDGAAATQSADDDGAKAATAEKASGETS